MIDKFVLEKTLLFWFSAWVTFFQELKICVGCVAFMGVYEAFFSLYLTMLLECVGGFAFFPFVRLSCTDCSNYICS